MLLDVLACLLLKVVVESFDPAGETCAVVLRSERLELELRSLRLIAHLSPQALFVSPCRRLRRGVGSWRIQQGIQDRKSTRLNSSHGYISYAVFCLKKKKKMM